MRPYRYGFNGKENDNEVKGVEGSQQDYGMRIYDPRVAKFLSVDPLTQQYPHYTPYSFAGNKPISFIDRDGEEEGSIDLRMRRIEDAYFSGQIDENQYRGQIKAMGAPGVIGAVVLTDVFVTKGWLSRTMLIYNIFTLYDHNPAKTEEGKLIQEEKFKNGVADLVVGYAISKAIGSFVKSINTIAVTKAKFDPSKLERLDEVGGKYQFYHYDNQYIGTWEKVDDIVSIEINLPAKLQNMGIGNVIFREAVQDVKGFKALWVNNPRIYETGSSVNLLRYRSGLKNGLSPEQAAWNTWSGSQAKANGFKNVQVTELKDGDIEAIFTK